MLALDPAIVNTEAKKPRVKASILTSWSPSPASTPSGAPSSAARPNPLAQPPSRTSRTTPSPDSRSSTWSEHHPKNKWRAGHPHPVAQRVTAILRAHFSGRSNNPLLDMINKDQGEAPHNSFGPPGEELQELCGGNGGGHQAAAGTAEPGALQAAAPAPHVQHAAWPTVPGQEGGRTLSLQEVGSSAGDVTVSLGENGWAWLVSGRRLVIWRCKAMGGRAQYRELGLPPSDLAHRSAVYRQSCYIAVSPEGVVRYEGSSTDTSAELGGLECYNLTDLGPVGCNAGVGAPIRELCEASAGEMSGVEIDESVTVAARFHLQDMEGASYSPIFCAATKEGFQFIAFVGVVARVA